MSVEYNLMILKSIEVIFREDSSAADAQKIQKKDKKVKAYL